MANEVAKLVFEADTKQLKDAETALDGVAGAANDATQATENYTDANGRLRDAQGRFVKKTDQATKANNKFAKGLGRTGKLLGGMKVKALVAGSAIGAMAFAVNKALNSVEETGSQFSILQAQLVTATGSTAAAASEFERLNKFALQTPFTLEESVKGFVLLTNLGLNPSERAMTSFADTSAAMGQSLDSMIEAVADATTFEFERLKQFGIKSSQEGDKVKFTFRGITTEVNKNAKAVESFLVGLGETFFAGAAIQQTKTLAGSISNLEQGFFGLKIAMGEAAGANEVFAKTNNDLAATLNDPKFQEGLAILTRTFAEVKDAIVGFAGAAATGLVDVLTTTESEMQDALDSLEARAEKANGNLEKRLKNRIKRLKADLAELREAKSTADEAAAAPEVAEDTAKQIAVDSAGADPFADDDFGAEMEEVITPFEAAILKDIALRDKRMELNAQELEDMREHDQRKKDLVTEFDELKNADLISGRVDMLEQLKSLDEAELKLQDMTGKQKTKLAIGLGGQLLSAVAAQSKKGFEVFKAAQLAEAIIGGYKAVQNSYEKGTKIGGPPVGAAFAAVAAVQTAAQVKAIQATQFKGGGGGSISSPSGGGSISGAAAASDSPVQAAANDDLVTAPQTVNVTVDGSIDPSGARRIIEAINEATEDGLEINALVGT